MTPFCLRRAATASTDLRVALTMIARERAGEERRLRDVEEDQTPDGPVDQVDDVVEADGQLVDVLAVDRRDEGPVDAAEDLVRDLVALVLEALDLVRDRPRPATPLEEAIEDHGALVDAPRHVGEPVEVPLVARKEIEHRAPVVGG